MVRNASSRSADLRKELSSLTGVLIDAKELFENADSLNRASIESVLANLIVLMNELLERTTPKKTDALSRRLLWPFRERENDEFVSKIERYKADLSLSLS